MDTRTPEAILKETRQAKGIAIEAVHEATKIPLDVLKAIEEGYTVRALASPFYRKQFIKMYSAFLGIEIKGMAFVEPPKEEKKPLAFKKIPVKEKEFEPNRGILLSKQHKQQIVLAIGALLVLFLVTKVVAFIGSKIAQHRSVPKEAVKVKEQKPKQVVKKKAPEKAKVRKPEVKNEDVKKEEIKKEEPDVDPLESAAVPAVSVPAVPFPVDAAAHKQANSTESESRLASSVLVPPQSGKVVNLTVRAKKKSWLQVKVDGNTVFQSSLQKGAVENWQADDRIELTGNNILFLEFEVNGKMIGTLSRTEGRARKLIITKDGLSVKR